MKPKNYVSVKVPFEILCRSKGKNKQDPFFYAGNNIAKAKILNREYVLTTVGMYDFTLITGKFSVRRLSQGRHFRIVSNDIRRFRDIARNYQLTDNRIRYLTDNGALISNWGWFGINVWEDGKCLDYPTDAWSTYDEAMEHFKRVIQEDLEGNKIHNYREKKKL